MTIRAGEELLAWNSVLYRLDFCGGEKKMRTGLSIKALGMIAFATASLSLAACSDLGPTPMPSGYTYHSDTYKAPPGPEPIFRQWGMAYDADSSWIPEDMSTSIDDSAMTDHDRAAVEVTTPMVAPISQPAPSLHDKLRWQDASRDLLSRLVSSFGQPAEAVYLKPGSGTADMMRHFSDALFVAMTEQGMTVAAQPGMGPFAMQYSAGDIGTPGRVLLTLTLMSGGQIAAEESGIYTVSPIPSYSGYKPRSHNSGDHGAPMMISPPAP